MSESHLTPEQLTILRRKLLARGRDLAEELSQVMSGKNPGKTVPAPGETVEEKLRRFLRVVQDRIDTILAGGPYGRCERCGAPISFVELSELPWADRCRACPSVG